MRTAGKHLAAVLSEVRNAVRAGVSTRELDTIAHDRILSRGCIPAFLKYKPDMHHKPFPATLCVSVNDEIVHGIPSERILKEGDIVSLDLGLSSDGFFADSAITVPVGEISKDKKIFLRDAEEALHLAIAQARAGNHIGDIGHAVESFIKPKKYGIVRDLSGHGIGRELHESPYVPNFGKKGSGEILRAGMTIAIEPILSMGRPEMFVASDGYTCKTSDGSLAAHFEHTILITDGEPEILTLI